MPVLTRSGQTVAEVSAGGAAWSNDANFVDNDADYLTSYAETANMSEGSVSNYLMAYTFSLGIPENATIDGIEVCIYARGYSMIAGEEIEINAVNLVGESGDLGDIKAPGQLLTGGGLSWYTFGSPTDKWGVDWSIPENFSILSSEWFGFQFRAGDRAGAEASGVCRAAHQEMKIYYSLPSAPEMEATLDKTYDSESQTHTTGRTTGSYDQSGSDISVVGNTHETGRDQGSYGEIGQDIAAAEDIHETGRTTGAYGVDGIADVVEDNIHTTSRTEGSYGSGGTTDEIEFTAEGATIITGRTEASYGSK